MEPSYAQHVAAALKLRLDRLFDSASVVVLQDADGMEAVQATVRHRDAVIGLTTAIREDDIAIMVDAAGYCDVIANLMGRKLVNVIMDTPQ